MKIRSFILSAMGALAVVVGFASCSDDDDDYDGSWQNGSKVELAQTRAFILNEGSMSHNNSNLIYFDWTTGQVNSSCIYAQQNGKQLGDTANDIITYDGRIIVAVNGSNYVALLNGAGVELSRVSIANDYPELGQVRSLVADDGFLYVTTYGGYIVRIRISGDRLEYAGNLNVGINLEGICEEDDMLYAVVAGEYPKNDSRVAVVNTKSFNSVTFGDVMYNPDMIVEEDGHIYVQGYGNYDYPWGEYDPITKKYTQIGNATALAAGDDVLYLANSVTNWNTKTTSTELYSYNTGNGAIDKTFFKNVPSEVKTAFVYSISVNPYNGDIFLATSDYVNDGKIYQFSKNGTYMGQFSSYGQNPNKIVFLR